MATATKRSPVVLDADKCVNCRLCTSVCDLSERLLDPLLERAEKVRAEGGSETLPVSPECYGCMDCVAVCPRGALRIETLGLDGGAGAKAGNRPPEKEAVKEGSAGDRGQAA
jgi:Fe-S-cluster-containing hydrogenase component 2